MVKKKRFLHLFESICLVEISKNQSHILNTDLFLYPFSLSQKMYNDRQNEKRNYRRDLLSSSTRKNCCHPLHKFSAELLNLTLLSFLFKNGKVIAVHWMFNCNLNFRVIMRKNPKDSNPFLHYLIISSHFNEKGVHAFQ